MAFELTWIRRRHFAGPAGRLLFRFCFGLENEMENLLRDLLRFLCVRNGGDVHGALLAANCPTSAHLFGPIYAHPSSRSGIDSKRMATYLERRLASRKPINQRGRVQRNRKRSRVIHN